MPTLQETKDFVKFISEQTLTEDEMMVSFDVSLFTSIPTDLAVQVARRRLEKDQTLPERTDLGVDDIVDLLILCLNATFLQYRGKVYQQVNGTAMGSPASVMIANLMMEDVEERVLTSFHPPPRSWQHYVDDTFTALPSDLVQQFLSQLNSIELCIHFTLEEETEGKLLFLDVCLQSEDNGSLTTSVFRKATHTNHYLSFDSHHPMAHT